MQVKKITAAVSTTWSNDYVFKMGLFIGYVKPLILLIFLLQNLMKSTSKVEFWMENPQMNPSYSHRIHVW